MNEKKAFILHELNLYLNDFVKEIKELLEYADIIGIQDSKNIEEFKKLLDYINKMHI